MSKPIVFYDIPGNAHSHKAWSPNTQKTRCALLSRLRDVKVISERSDLFSYSLNYKGIPYKTVWVEYPDIG